jgi:transposase InsO family protein
MQRVATDILGPLPETPSGNSYVLVVADYFTRWVEAFPIPNQEATTVARKLVNEVFCHFSPPEQLHSDQGRQFESLLLAEVCRLLGIQKTRTTAYHPQSDGLVERWNRTLLHNLSTCVRDHPESWEDYVRSICMAYNTSIHSTTGFTPFYLMFGRQAKLPVELMYGTPEPESLSSKEYASQLESSLTEAYEKVRANTTRQLDHQAELYEKVHGKPY